MNLLYDLQVDEAEGPRHIETTHNEHAPCVLITKKINEDGVEVISTCYLKMFSSAVSAINDPSTFEVVQLILGAYFIVGIKFPNAYKDILRFLELRVHGGLCQRTLDDRPHQTYNTFIRELKQKGVRADRSDRKAYF